MNILIIGKGGREHALGWKIASSPQSSRIYFLPGNGGTLSIGTNIDGDYNDFQFVKSTVERYKIDMVVIGPEDPISRGLSDYLSDTGAYVVAPSKNVAFLEASKIKAKRFMKKYHIPTADFDVFEDFDSALSYVQSRRRWPLVIKADGLCGGKGVEITRSYEEAQKVLTEFMINKKFGESSAKVVIEEYLKGYEFSVFAFLDGDKYTILGDAIDYKPVFDGDKGPNTGGMGSISPCVFLSQKMKQDVREKVIERTIRGLKSEGLYYKGFLYFGLMWTDKGPYVLEYNIRMGDPETQVLVLADERDWLYIFQHPSKFTGIWPAFKKTCVEVVLVSKGYPGKYQKGYEIHGLPSIKEAVLFHAGTRRENGKIITWGGRVLNVVACAEGLSEARKKVYKEVQKIYFDNIYYRKDIGEASRWKGIL